MLVTHVGVGGEMMLLNLMCQMNQMVGISV